MSKKRVHELAKEFGLENRDALLRLQAAGIEAKTHSSSVYEEEARAVLQRAEMPESHDSDEAKRRPGMMIVRKKPAAPSPAETQILHIEQEPLVVAKVETPTVFHPEVEELPVVETHVSVEAPPKPLREVDVELPPARRVSSSSTYFAKPLVDAAPRVQETELAGDVADADAGQPVERLDSPPEAPIEAKNDTTAVAQGKAGVIKRPSGAIVVRMIDREKLMERLPQGRRNGPAGASATSRVGMAGAARAATGPRTGTGVTRSGGASAGSTRGAPGSGPAGQRFGRVTELKVVHDPFRGGREMVPAAGGAPASRKPRGAPGGGDAARRGGPGGAPGAGGRPGQGGGRPARRDDRERGGAPSRLRRKKRGMSDSARSAPATMPKLENRVLRMKETIVVGELAQQLGVKVSDVIRKLMMLDIMASQNQSINFETAQVVAEEYEYRIESSAFVVADAIAGDEADKGLEENLKPRPPVVTVMGHVDHGKTSLLDAIRSTHVVKGEAGGITQHIGAYTVTLPDRGSVTFLDTPGHAAFTAMRARGAQATDIVVLVVAADDGVMPQTEEAIQHAQAAGVPIIVAVNKIDKPEANAERVMQELSRFGLISEAWGGETIFVQTSATKGIGIPELLESLIVQAEIMELKANPDCRADGLVIEAELSKGLGPVATILVQHGTLRRGDHVVVGEASGRVRAMVNHEGKTLDAVGPSGAVEITGLDLVPNAGDSVNVVDSAETAKRIVEHRRQQRELAGTGSSAARTLEDLMKRMKDTDVRELKIVLKADVQGSLEATKAALLKLSTDEVKVSVLYAGVGGIRESDITLAGASGGIVVGFGVRPDGNARAIAEREGVDVRTYTIIYQLVDEVKLAMEGLLTPESREKVVGRAEVREIFSISKVGTIAGSRVVEGKAQRSAKVRLLRDNVQVYAGTISSLKHFKDDAREVERGNECGIGLENFNDIKPGDVVEFYIIEQIARTLGAATAS